MKICAKMPPKSYRFRGKNMGNLIVKDNALIEASHKLNEIEQRLILLAIIKGREHCDSVAELKGKELVIHADDYIATFGVDRTTAYRVLKKAVLGLFEAKWGYKYINNNGSKVVGYERFTQSAKYIEDEGIVTFRFADEIIPMLVELERNFTTYAIEQVANLSSRYAMRLYEFFIRSVDKKKEKGYLVITLDELRFRLGLLPEEYARMYDFKRYVLDYAIKEINEHTNIEVSYTQQKRGKFISGFTFNIVMKPQDQKQTDTQRLENLTPQNDIEQEIVNQKNAYADQIGANTEHRNNLIRQALERYRQAELEAKEQEQAEQLAEQERQQKQKQLAELAQKSFECIKNNQDYLRQFCELNVKVKLLRGLEKFYFEDGNLEKFFLMQEKKFTDLDTFLKLDLSFLPQD